VNVPPLVAWSPWLQEKLRFMGSKQRTYTPEFREGAVRMAIETGRPIPEVAEECLKKPSPHVSPNPVHAGQGHTDD